MRGSMSDDDELLTVLEVAERLKVNQQTVRNCWTEATCAGPRRIRVRESDLEAFLEQRSGANLKPLGTQAGLPPIDERRRQQEIAAWKSLGTAMSKTMSSVPHGNRRQLSKHLEQLAAAADPLGIKRRVEPDPEILSPLLVAKNRRRMMAVSPKDSPDDRGEAKRKRSPRTRWPLGRRCGDRIHAIALVRSAVGRRVHPWQSTRPAPRRRTRPASPLRSLGSRWDENESNRAAMARSEFRRSGQVIRQPVHPPRKTPRRGRSRVLFDARQL